MTGSLFTKLSIRWKLVLVIMFVAALVAVTETVLFIAYDARSYFKYQADRTEMVAKIVAENCIPALQFKDRADALEILNSLNSAPSIEEAYLFDNAGGVLAEYLHSGNELAVPMVSISKDYTRRTEDSLIVVRTVAFREQPLGALYLRSNLKDLAQRRHDTLVLGSITGLAMLCVALLAAVLLQRVFSAPVRALNKAIYRVTRNRDYTVRAEHASQDEFGALVVGFNTMLDEIHHRDKELALQVALLARTNKELDEFVYVASHDLKAPLRAVENLARLIGKAVKDILPPQNKELLDLLQGRVRRMEKLLDDLLEYSRVGRVQGAKSIVDVTELLRDIVQLLDPQPPFKVIVPSHLPTLETYRTPLEQVLRNLMSNAIKHHNRKDGTIQVQAIDKGSCLEFSIRDDGPGIAGKYHEKIFQMFQTLRPRDEVEGSGMGLALVKKIVEDQKGKIWLESEEGKGSCFFFTWPKG